MKTLYQKAQEAMNIEISRYLDLIRVSNGFSNLKATHLSDPKTALLFAGGIGVMDQENSNHNEYTNFLINEFNRKIAIPFDVENAVCLGVYQTIRPYIEELFNQAEEITNQFTEFEPQIIKNNSYLLPIFQNILGYTKSQLKRKFGSISDNQISVPASEKLANSLKDFFEKQTIDKQKVLQRIEVTLEGIVRDLVGRILFEEIVAHSLDQNNVSYLREEDYKSLSGVIYDFRADFIIPNPQNPIAFIEVRKSSNRHASLYAKDKMFSAINWKGKHKKLIAIIIVEGEWTYTTLKTMSKVFDYVVPLNKISEVAKILKKAQDGDETILKWLIDFTISPSPHFSGQDII